MTEISLLKYIEEEAPKKGLEIKVVDGRLLCLDLDNLDFVQDTVTRYQTKRRNREIIDSFTHFMNLLEKKVIQGKLPKNTLISRISELTDDVLLCFVETLLAVTNIDKNDIAEELCDYSINDKDNLPMVELWIDEYRGNYSIHGLDDVEFDAINDVIRLLNAEFKGKRCSFVLRYHDNSPLHD